MAARITSEAIFFGEVVANDVNVDDYMAHYAANFCEWIDGSVIRVSPVHGYHDELTRYLAILLEAYFELRTIGRIRQAPFVMALPKVANRRREPDIQVILNTNSGTLTSTFMDGPADICIEVVSPESIERDHGEKFAEYEKGGVSEYWIIDPIRSEGRFYRLNEEGVYIRQVEDTTGNYYPAHLPRFVLHVPALWNDNLPGPVAIVQMVQNMLDAEQ